MMSISHYPGGSSHVDIQIRLFCALELGLFGGMSFITWSGGVADFGSMAAGPYSLRNHDEVASVGPALFFAVLIAQGCILVSALVLGFTALLWSQTGELRRMTLVQRGVALGIIIVGLISPLIRSVLD